MGRRETVFLFAASGQAVQTRAICPPLPALAMGVDDAEGNHDDDDQDVDYRPPAQPHTTIATESSPQPKAAAIR